MWRELGHTSLEDFLVEFWEGFFLDGRDPNNLLTMLHTWWNGDVGRIPGFASTEEALASIRARAIVAPAERRTSIFRPRTSGGRSGTCRRRSCG